jgi:hypothetical protein
MLLVLLAWFPTASRAQIDPVFDVAGPGIGRTMLSLLPFERIDSVTGNIFMSFTDLVLPGPAGFNLSFVRTYNSSDGKWRFGLDGVPLIVTRALCCGGGTYQWTFELPSGAQQQTPFSGARRASSSCPTA